MCYILWQVNVKGACTMNMKSVIKPILAAELVLLVPLLAMVFSWDGWDWKPLDFVLAGVLLAGIGIGAHLIINGIKQGSKQLILGVVLAVLMILTWIELAVGIFGTPFAGS